MAEGVGCAGGGRGGASRATPQTTSPALRNVVSLPAGSPRTNLRAFENPPGRATRYQSPKAGGEGGRRSPGPPKGGPPKHLLSSQKGAPAPLRASMLTPLCLRNFPKRGGAQKPGSKLGPNPARCRGRRSVGAVPSGVRVVPRGAMGRVITVRPLGGSNQGFGRYER